MRRLRRIGFWALVFGLERDGGVAATLARIARATSCLRLHREFLWLLEPVIWDFRPAGAWPVIHPNLLTKTLLSVCDPTRAVQLATKGGEID